MDAGKRGPPSVKAADDDGMGSRRIFVTDKATLTSFLVDTGADISVYPRSKIHPPTNEQMRIRTVRGQWDADPDVRHHRRHPQPVPQKCIHMAICDSQRPITHHRCGLFEPLWVARGPAKQPLIDTRTQLTARGYTGTTDGASVRNIVGESVYHRLLMEFPDLTRPSIFGREKIRHGVVHHIETTPGSPVYSKPRRLAPDRLKEVKMEGAYDCRRNFFYQQDSRPQRNTRTGLKNEWKRSGRNRARVMAKGKFSFSKNWIPRLTFSYATTRRVALYSLNSMDSSKL